MTSDYLALIAKARSAPNLSKRDFIRQRVRGKCVLDLGCIGHSLADFHASPDRWLHRVICDAAASVVGVDLLAPEIVELQQQGYEVLVGDALNVRLSQRFDVVVCGDLLEHVTNPGALLETISFHLKDDGFGVVTTPNPFGASRFFNIIFDGWTGINTEHVAWFCPQTFYQLCLRSPLEIDEFCWLETDFPMPSHRPFLGAFANFIAPRLARRKQLLRNDFGVTLRRKLHNPAIQVG